MALTPVHEGVSAKKHFPTANNLELVKIYGRIFFFKILKKTVQDRVISGVPW